MRITKEMFLDYEDVRQSGATNMCDVATVRNLSGLEKEEIRDIMQNYAKYEKEFLDNE